MIYPKSVIRKNRFHFTLKIERKMHIVLAYRYYNDGIVYYNLTFCTKKSLMTDLGLNGTKLDPPSTQSSVWITKKLK